MLSPRLVTKPANQIEVSVGENRFLNFAPLSRNNKFFGHWILQDFFYWRLKNSSIDFSLGRCRLRKVHGRYPRLYSTKNIGVQLCLPVTIISAIQPCRRLLTFCALFPERPVPKLRLAKHDAERLPLGVSECFQP